MSEVREIRALTGLRGLAAVYVVLFHYFSGSGFANPALTFLSHGYLAVDLFFVLSGFVMTLNYAELFRGGLEWKSFRTFLTRRLARVYPLFLLATLIAAILISLGWLEGTHSSLKMALLWNVLMIQAWGLAPSLDGPGWSISAEWAAYLLFPLALTIGFNPTSRRARATVLLSLIVIATLTFLPTSMVHRPRPEMLLHIFRAGGWPVIRCLAEFFLGIFAARTFAIQRDRWAERSGRLATVTGLAMLTLLAVRNSDFFFVALCPLLVLSLTSRAGLMARLTGSRLVHHLGLISYSIYLVHDLLGGLVTYLHRYANEHGLHHGQTYGAAAAIVLVYPFSLMAYHFVEKPCRRIVRQMLEGKQTKTTTPLGPLGIPAP